MQSNEKKTRSIENRNLEIRLMNSKSHWHPKNAYSNWKWCFLFLVRYENNSILTLSPFWLAEFDAYFVKLKRKGCRSTLHLSLKTIWHIDATDNVKVFSQHSITVQSYLWHEKIMTAGGKWIPYYIDFFGMNLTHHGGHEINNFHRQQFIIYT